MTRGTTPNAAESSHPEPEPVDTLVVGAGLPGLVTAWFRARSGATVVVVDDHAPRAASPVAAGMLTPASEATFGEDALMRLAMLSRDRFLDFVHELEQESGENVAHHPGGTLQVAFDTDDLAVLTRLLELHERLGVKTERLTSRECRRLEPMLATSIRGGIFAPEDDSVDPRRLAKALRVAAERRGVEFVTGHAARLAVSDGRCHGADLDDGRELRAAATVVAAGAWTSLLDGVPADVPRVRPVKGQLLRLRLPKGGEPLVTRTVRGLVRGTPVYAVPRKDGEVVLGATQEERGFDGEATAGGLWQVLRDGHDLLPGLSELDVVEVNVGMRPATADNAPLLGPTRVPGLFLATGHHRHGVLLCPVTGDVLSHALEHGHVPDYAAEFAATRHIG
ncbi:glycine oxidase ThiO [Spiractinospora alimapuensis]|uniref:glycine oxidase ThiO n=1 Tax=Spiractinospora alimapuensis TaxID=2820884 RepID=UPI001F4469C3|nr:glycine oxidase ThiO [Spiractinospora alimapuensis]QVQ53214.1 glycine oxidase ThiO [Spiractinospora alimapuensis]